MDNHNIDLAAVAVALNERYGKEQQRKKVKPRPLPISLQERAELLAFYAEREQRRAEQVRVAELYLSRPLSDNRSAACAAARAEAVKSRPAECQGCGQGLPLEAHHVTPYAVLVAQGRENDQSAHQFVWLCNPCHEAQHAHQPHVVRLIRGRLGR